MRERHRVEYNLMFTATNQITLCSIGTILSYQFLAQHYALCLKMAICATLVISILTRISHTIESLPAKT